jgi:hypothetical protein
VTGPRKTTRRVRSLPRRAWTGATEPSSWQFNYVADVVEDLSITSGHPYFKLGKSKGDIGGDFKVKKQILEEGGSHSRHIWTRYPGQSIQSSTENYRGPVFAKQSNVGAGSFPVVNFTDNTSIDAKGTTAIKITIPTNPIAGLATVIGEAKEGLPRLWGVSSWKNRTGIARSAGSEYLNHQFGWIPLVNDMQNFSTAVRDHDKIIRQYERNSGKRVKRQFDFPLESNSSVTTTPGVSSVPLFNTNFYDGANGAFGEMTTTTTTEVKTWFKGCFSYYLPPYDPQGNNFSRNEQIANKLFGTRFTPEVAWNITPWTWALDWVGNMGDVIHNASAFVNDGLVMPYGYVMQQKTVSIEYRLTGIRFRSETPKKADFYQKFTTITKSRRTATPYGFGLNTGGFSIKQWAILGALGLTKSDRVLGA